MDRRTRQRHAFARLHAQVLQEGRHAVGAPVQFGIELADGCGRSGQVLPRAPDVLALAGAALGLVLAVALRMPPRTVAAPRVIGRCAAVTVRWRSRPAWAAGRTPASP